MTIVFFWRVFKYDFEESNNPELVDNTYFAPFIEDDPYIFNTNLSFKFNVVADIA